MVVVRDGPILTLIIVVPGAPQLPGLVEDLLHLRVILDHDGIFNVKSGCLARLLDKLALIGARGGHSTGAEKDVEVRRQMTRTGRQMHALRIVVVALREDQTVKRTIEFDVNTHVVLLALYV